MIAEFHIDSFTAANRNRVNRLNRKFRRGEPYTKADQAFDDWWNAEASRHHSAREELKCHGWELLRNDSLSVEERARGAEMVIYAHWHRQYDPCHPVELKQYAGCWVDANSPTLVTERYSGSAVEKILRERYPLIGKRRLQPGYTYFGVGQERTHKQNSPKPTRFEHSDE